MSNWLRSHLLLWVCAVVLGAVCWNTRVIQAQSENYAGARTEGLSREEAVRQFADLMKSAYVVSEDSVLGIHYARVPASVSQKSARQFSGKVEPFLVELALDWNAPLQTVRVQSESDKVATVVVEEDSTPAARPLVLVEEDGSWGVDLLETYARWNNLEGPAKAEAIYRITGIETPELVQTPEFLRDREIARRSSCQSQLKQIMLGIKQYTQDYDEKLPLAKPWIDVLQPYLKSERIFNCPSIPRGQQYGYAYNAKLSNKNETISWEWFKVVTIFETSVLKRNAYGTGENLAFRHEEGANYAFLDGHVKWLAKNKVPSFNWGRTGPPEGYP